MNVRRKFLIGVVAAGLAAPVVLLQLSQAPDAVAQDGVSAGRRGGGGGGNSGPLTRDDVRRILQQAQTAANATDSGLRAVNGQVRKTKMHIAVVARNGAFIDMLSMPDAWEGSKDIAIAKARTAAFFSSNENALTSRIIGVLSQAHNPDGSEGAGPLWGIWVSNQEGITGSSQFRNGLIPFPGGVPLYKNGVLAGGVGVSGDGVDQDEDVAFAGAAGFAPPAGIAKLGFE